MYHISFSSKYVPLYVFGGFVIQLVILAIFLANISAYGAIRAYQAFLKNSLGGELEFAAQGVSGGSQDGSTGGWGPCFYDACKSRGSSSSQEGAGISAVQCMAPVRSVSCDDPECNSGPCTNAGAAQDVTVSGVHGYVYQFNYRPPTALHNQTAYLDYDYTPLSNYRIRIRRQRYCQNFMSGFEVFGDNQPLPDAQPGQRLKGTVSAPVVVAGSYCDYRYAMYEQYVPTSLWSTVKYSNTIRVNLSNSGTGSPPAGAVSPPPSPAVAPVPSPSSSPSANDSSGVRFDTMNATPAQVPVSGTFQQYPVSMDYSISGLTPGQWVRMNLGCCTTNPNPVSPVHCEANLSEQYCQQNPNKWIYYVWPPCAFTVTSQTQSGTCPWSSGLRERGLWRFRATVCSNNDSCLFSPSNPPIAIGYSNIMTVGSSGTSTAPTAGTTLTVLPTTVYQGGKVRLTVSNPPPGTLGIDVFNQNGAKMNIPTPVFNTTYTYSREWIFNLSPGTYTIKLKKPCNTPPTYYCYVSGATAQLKIISAAGSSYSVLRQPDQLSRVQPYESRSLWSFLLNFVGGLK